MVNFMCDYFFNEVNPKDFVEVPDLNEYVSKLIEDGGKILRCRNRFPMSNTDVLKNFVVLRENIAIMEPTGEMDYFPKGTYLDLDIWDLPENAECFQDNFDNCFKVLEVV
jgi:hypothetical protein